jgi:hypothetical protein
MEDWPIAACPLFTVPLYLLMRRHVNCVTETAPLKNLRASPFPGGIYTRGQTADPLTTTTITAVNLELLPLV